MKLKTVIYLAVMFMLALAVGCHRKPEYSGPQYESKVTIDESVVYKFAVHPLHNPMKLVEAYQPLMDYLNDELGWARFQLVTSLDYSDFEKKVGARKPDFLLPNPWQTLNAIKVGYHVIAMAGEPEDFRGIFIVRKDSGIEQPAQLKGKAVCYPSPTALAACIMPQYFLFQHGIDINRDIENRYVGSQESSIMSVYLGNTAAGATWPEPWRAFMREHPQEASTLKIAWQTESLINNSVMAREDVPDTVRERVRTLLVGLNGTEDGLKILSGTEIARFTTASDSDYAVARDYVARFEREVRKVVAK